MSGWWVCEGGRGNWLVGPVVLNSPVRHAHALLRLEEALDKVLNAARNNSRYMLFRVFRNAELASRRFSGCVNFLVEDLIWVGWMSGRMGGRSCSRKSCTKQNIMCKVFCDV